ncbi:hypothetical protein HF086_016334 [Spodoptera exigua]|uniref:Uncharacterized protein n=1 Tax=Spodoptera exigua TaxID=7107 RepID=A0A922MRK9_SPOEX|nr:hypothetical protein HF086_016334 [Spodoptera exigua]
MEPLKTHSTVLPQQVLTRPVGGCPSGPRPEDLLQVGHEGANPHVGQREAMITDDLSLNTDPRILTKLEIYNVLVEKAKQFGSKQRPGDLESNDRTMVILNALYPTGIPDNLDVHNKNLKDSISKFINNCEKLYNNSKRNFKRFTKKNEKWLSTIFDIPIPTKIEKSPIELNTSSPSDYILKPQEPESSDMSSVSNILFTEPVPGPSHEIPSTTNNTIPGTSNNSPSASNEMNSRQMLRIRKSLEESLQDQPRSKIIKMMSKIVTDEIHGEKLVKSSPQELEFVINECLKSPTRPKKIASSMKAKVEAKPYTPEEALSLVIDRKLTVEDYSIIQKDLKERGFPAYPPYFKLKIAKQMCYPDEDIVITEREASVSVHSLLLHTFRRIIKLSTESISQYCKQKQKNILHCRFEGSWGFDGSTGQAFYKQKFLDGDNENENCLFTTTYIPLRLKTNDGFVLWSNPCPQSYRFCRPLKIQYRNETKELITEEKNRVQAEIDQLTPLYAETDEGQSIISDTKLYLTVIDGKVFNVITGTTSQLRCACCGATATEFNQLDVVINKPVNPEALRHGISPLHAWIRIFEFLLHLGYKNDPAVMKWRINKKSPAATIVEERKKNTNRIKRQTVTFG